MPPRGTNVDGLQILGLARDDAPPAEHAWVLT